MNVIVKKLIKSVFPGAYDALWRHRLHHSESGALKNESELCSLSDRACHYKELFIRNDGMLLPCCLVSRRGGMEIAHINDNGLEVKLKGYFRQCTCETYRLISASDDDYPNFELLNIETSLMCQGDCAMCCVQAPDWRGKYDLYPSLTTFIARYRPKEIIIQGGEILVQKASIEWMESIKKEFPNIRRTIVTNANVDLNLAETVSVLFDRIIVSVVGFQDDTYRAIMGMNVNKMKSFVHAVSATKRNNLILKYLVSPLGVHEADLFLVWAIEERPKSIMFQDSGTESYYNMNTTDGYWNKIITRSGKRLKNALAVNAYLLRETGISVSFDKSTLKLYDIDSAFTESNKIADVVKWGRLAGSSIIEEMIK